MSASERCASSARPSAPTKKRPSDRRVERHPSLDDRFDSAIRIVDHDPEWASLARAEMRRIAGALGEVAVRVDHVGSTAAPGLAAKPIIDLQLSVAAIDPLERYREPLERLGYLFVP